VYRHLYRSQVLYGRFRTFVDISQEISAHERTQGWAVSTIWTPTVGVANEAVIIADYESLADFERERRERYADGTYMTLAQRAAELMAQGTFRDELLEEAPRLVDGS
jgi:hypothetical protein